MESVAGIGPVRRSIQDGSGTDVERWQLRNREKRLRRGLAIGTAAAAIVPFGDREGVLRRPDARRSPTGQATALDAGTLASQRSTRGWRRIHRGIAQRRARP